MPNTMIIPTHEMRLTGGTRITRVLPSKRKRMIGAWCFFDHLGPISFIPNNKILDVGPHPHIGLQTFTWMIEGQVLHNDSLGIKQILSPGQINLMTAGKGIVHTEESLPNSKRLHAVQLWIALPKNSNAFPAFEHYPFLPMLQKGSIKITILIGSLFGETSTVKVYTPLIAAQLSATLSDKIILPLDQNFEYGIFVLEGSVILNNQQRLDNQNLFVQEKGETELTIEMAQGSKVFIFGGEPMHFEPIVWWNFVGKDKEDVAQAWLDWVNHSSRFGDVENYDGERLIAPDLPERLK